MRREKKLLERAAQARYVPARICGGQESVARIHGLTAAAPPSGMDQGGSFSRPICARRGAGLRGARPSALDGAGLRGARPSALEGAGLRGARPSALDGAGLRGARPSALEGAGLCGARPSALEGAGLHEGAAKRMVRCRSEAKQYAPQGGGRARTAGYGIGTQCKGMFCARRGYMLRQGPEQRSGDPARRRDANAAARQVFFFG